MKKLLFITILLTGGYSQPICDPDFYNCDCNEYTWQEWYPNMEGCWLYYANLGGANLEGADLSWAVFTGASIYNANLAGSNLSWSDLDYSILIGSDLSDADLTGASLYRADLESTNLSSTFFYETECFGSYFVWANLDNTIFESADLTYAYFDENEDEYDDASYDAGASSGDVNLDTELNILDIIASVNMILEGE